MVIFSTVKWSPLLGLVSAIAIAFPARAGNVEIPSAFFISKSENKNQVHYAVLVDDNCRPVGNAPVRPYWRELERGPGVTSPLLDREQPAYGIASQTVTSGEIVLTLRALPARPLRIETARGQDGACASWTHMTIAAEPSQLYQIHVTLRLFSIDSILLTGWTWTDRRVIRETLKP